MKILVTGATGFIGRHVVQWLVNNGFTDVIATSTSLEKAQEMSWYNHVTYIQCDYFKEERDYYTHFMKPDILIHCAWKGVSDVSNRNHILLNLPTEIHFLDWFINAGKTKLVVVGSCYEYGTVNGCLSEEITTNPNTYYAIAKDTLRRYLELRTKYTSVSWNWIRVFFQYGEGQNPKSLLPQLESAIQRGDTIFPLSSGEQLRDYISVSKTAELICKIALQNKIAGIVNCCSGTPISVRRFAESIIMKHNSPIKLDFGAVAYRDYEGLAYWGDITKMKSCIDEFDKHRFINLHWGGGSSSEKSRTKQPTYPTYQKSTPYFAEVSV